MPAAAEPTGAVTAAAAAIRELAGPVDYAAIWTLVALGLVAAVLVWNLGVLWWGRPRRVPAPPPAAAAPDPVSVREEHLAELDRIEAGVRAGRLELRPAYQQLSAATRSYVHETTDVPARHLALADLRAAGLAEVAAAVAVMYPPEFAPGREADAAGPDERFAEALRRAREVVGTSWT